MRAVEAGAREADETGEGGPDGILGLKFMQKAMSKKRKANIEAAKALLEEMSGSWSGSADGGDGGDGRGTPSSVQAGFKKESRRARLRRLQAEGKSVDLLGNSASTAATGLSAGRKLRTSGPVTVRGAKGVDLEAMVEAGSSDGGNSADLFDANDEDVDEAVARHEAKERSGRLGAATKARKPATKAEKRQKKGTKGPRTTGTGGGDDDINMDATIEVDVDASLAAADEAEAAGPILHVGAGAYGDGSDSDDGAADNPWLTSADDAKRGLRTAAEGLNKTGKALAATRASGGGAGSNRRASGRGGGGGDVVDMDKTLLIDEGDGEGDGGDGAREDGEGTGGKSKSVGFNLKAGGKRQAELVSQVCVLASSDFFFGGGGRNGLSFRVSATLLLTLLLAKPTSLSLPLIPFLDTVSQRRLFTTTLSPSLRRRRPRRRTAGSPRRSRSRPAGARGRGRGSRHARRRAGKRARRARRARRTAERRSGATPASKKSSSARIVTSAPPPTSPPRSHTSLAGAV